MSDGAQRTRAVAYAHSGPIDAPDAFIDVEIELPPPAPHDLLVEVRAVSVNPVDVKLRGSSDPGGTPRVLGFDASGVVREVGAQVSAFTPGDEVFYAGSIARPGTDADLHLVDERIVGHKPASLDFAEAAALPLTTITAWEALFDKLALNRDSRGVLLVVGAAGGAGSIVVQLAHRLTGLTVIGTASRPDSIAWAHQMGADELIHPRELVSAVRRVAADGVDHIFSPFSAGNTEAYAEVLKPRGAVVAIDQPHGLDLLPLKPKSQTWHWEYMFSRPLHEPHSTYQRELLDTVARLIDDGVLRTTLTRRVRPLNPETLTQAHREVERSASIGKLVLEVG